MSLNILHRRRGREQAMIDEYAFELDENSSFLIINESTLAEQTFSYAEVIDGSYDTWLAGAEGGILEWTYNGIIFKNGFSSYVRLKSNAGSPYLNDWDQSANLGVTTPVNMAQDWIITVILDRELVGFNQRMNVGVRGSGTNLFGLQLMTGGYGDVVIDRQTGGVPDFRFSFPDTTVFKLLTFSRISGVVTVEVDNVTATQTANTGALQDTGRILENTIVLGSRSYPGAGSGKITNYKHLKVKTGDLSGFDRSTYNQAIMTKYGI